MVKMSKIDLLAMTSYRCDELMHSKVDTKIKQKTHLMWPAYSNALNETTLSSNILLFSMPN